MDSILQIAKYVPPFLVILTILIFVHEYGHYALARRHGVRVEVFSIGFGPEMFGWTDKRGTRWKFSAIPLGGYVKMFGETEKAVEADGTERPLTVQERSLSFHHKTVGQRAAIVFAGPFINYLFAILVLMLLFMIGGQPYTPAVLGPLEKGGPAERAGLMTGDRILRIAGQSIDRFEEVHQAVALRPGERVTAIVERDGRRIEASIEIGRRTVTDRHGNEQVFGDLGAGRYLPPRAGRVVEGGAAHAAGIRTGDVFLKIDGETVATFEDVRRIVAAAPGRPLAVVLRREGKTVETVLTPKREELVQPDGSKRAIGLIGVGSDATVRRTLDPLNAAHQAVRETYTLTVATFTAVGQIIVGSRSARDLSGPLRIAELSGEMAQISLYAFVWFLGVMSLQLCLINLLPVPMLDGGHLLYYGVEALRGKPLGQRAQEYGFRIGMALVLTLMVFATWNDLVHLRVVDFIKNLFV